jgi:hypothetical protein
MRGLRALVGELEPVGVTADLCLKGTFVTDEPDPDGIEVEVIVATEFYRARSKEQLALLQGSAKTGP